MRHGWLIGFNAGEYGGSLWWYRSAGSGGIKLSSENIISLLSTADEAVVLVVVGIAHMGIDQGRLLRFRYIDGRPTLTPLVNLGTEPQVVLLDPEGTALVLTNNDLRRVHLDGSSETLCNANYWGLYPTSMAVLASGEIYVGMRHFLGSLIPSSNASCAIQWFVPADCPRFVLRGADQCACGH